MSFIVNNGGVDGEIQVGKGLGSRLQFRGRIFGQRFADWTEIRAFKHFAWIHETTNLGGNSIWGKVDAFLRYDGVFEHQYPKHEQLIVGTFCRYARELGVSILGADVKFHTDYDNTRGLVLITERDGRVWDSTSALKQSIKN